MAEIACEYVLRKDAVQMNHETTVGSTKIKLESSMSSFGLKGEENPILDGFLTFITEDFNVSVNVRYHKVNPTEVETLTPEEKKELLSTISFTDYICREEQEFSMKISKEIRLAIKNLYEVAVDAVPNLLYRFKTLTA